MKTLSWLTACESMSAALSSNLEFLAVEMEYCTWTPTFFRVFVYFREQFRERRDAK